MSLIHEEGTGAVRSNDLARERWDLISGAALFGLYSAMDYNRYDTPVKTLVDNSISMLYRFLGNVSGCPESRVDWLVEGWASLATAIQQIDMAPKELDALLRFLEESGTQHYPYHACRRLAITCDEGAEKYGEHNWLHGFHVSGLANHGLRHLVKWSNGDRGEDHLGHTMWSFMAIHHMYHHRPDMSNLLLGVDYTLTDELKERHPHKKREPMGAEEKKIEERLRAEKKAADIDLLMKLDEKLRAEKGQ